MCLLWHALLSHPWRHQGTVFTTHIPPPSLVLWPYILPSSACTLSNSTLHFSGHLSDSPLCVSLLFTFMPLAHLCLCLICLTSDLLLSASLAFRIEKCGSKWPKNELSGRNIVWCMSSTSFFLCAHAYFLVVHIHATHPPTSLPAVACVHLPTPTFPPVPTCLHLLYAPNHLPTPTSACLCASTSALSALPLTSCPVLPLPSGLKSVGPNNPRTNSSGGK